MRVGRPGGVPKRSTSMSGEFDKDNNDKNIDYQSETAHTRCGRFAAPPPPG